jgi:hypothetical protein
VDFTGSIPPGVIRVTLYLGDDQDDARLNLDTVFTWRERLGGTDGNDILFSGFPGIGSPTDFAEPAPQDPFFWDPLTRRPVGISDEGTIQRAFPLDDRILCGLRSGQRGAWYQIRGYPPVNASIENQLIVEKIDGEVGINSYDSGTVDREGQTIYFAYAEGFWALRGVRVVQIDDKVRDHPLFPVGSDGTFYVSQAGDVVAFAEAEYRPDRATKDTADVKTGFMMSVPAIWMLEVHTGVWSSTQRIGTNDDQTVRLFDSPGFTGGLGTYLRNGKRVFAVGTYGQMNLMDDEDQDLYELEKMHLQTLTTHQMDLRDPAVKRIWRVMAHSHQPWGLKMPIVIPSEGQKSLKKDYVSFAKPRDIVGDTTKYSTFSKGGRGTPRVSVAIGMYGEELLAGQDRSYPESLYTNFTIDHVLPNTRMNLVRIEGRVDRVDVFAGRVEDLTVLIRPQDDAGNPGQPIAVGHMNTPLYGMQQAPNNVFHWFPVPIETETLSGEYFIEIRGDARLRSFPGALDLFDEDGVVLGQGINLAFRAVQEIGGPFVSREVIGLWADWVPMGKLTW